jgi:hypothetical protein
VGYSEGLVPSKGTIAVKKPIAVTAVLRPVAARLNRIEDLLVEVRLVLDLHLKRIDMLQRRVDALAEPTRRTVPAARRRKG